MCCGVSQNTYNTLVDMKLVFAGNFQISHQIYGQQTVPFLTQEMRVCVPICFVTIQKAKINSVKLTQISCQTWKEWRNPLRLTQNFHRKFHRNMQLRILQATASTLL